MASDQHQPIDEAEAIWLAAAVHSCSATAEGGNGAMPSVRPVNAYAYQGWLWW